MAGGGGGHTTPGAHWKGNLKPRKKARAPPGAALHRRRSGKEKQGHRKPGGVWGGGQRGEGLQGDSVGATCRQVFALPSEKLWGSQQHPPTNPNRERRHPFPSVLPRVAIKCRFHAKGCWHQDGIREKKRAFVELTDVKGKHPKYTTNYTPREAVPEVLEQI